MTDSEEIFVHPAVKLKHSAGFEINFRKAMMGKAVLNVNERKVMSVLNSPDSPRRSRRLARMERQARRAMGAGENVSIDWSAVDWGAILKTVLELIIKILPLILA